MRQGVIYAQNTNVMPPFASAAKAGTIRHRLVTLFQVHAQPMQSGLKPQQAAYDPFKRPVPYLQEQWRINGGNGGKARGLMRPARVGMVYFQQGNELQQRTRRPIGPVNTTYQQSILHRIYQGVSSQQGG